MPVAGPVNIPVGRLKPALLDLGPLLGDKRLITLTTHSFFNCTKVFMNDLMFSYITFVISFIVFKA